MFDKIKAALIAAVLIGAAAALDYFANDQGVIDALGPFAPILAAAVPFIAGYLRPERYGYGRGVQKP